ncbi:MAG: hypothetical protein WBN68_06120 [Sedimenticolaceae bacterium]
MIETKQQVVGNFSVRAHAFLGEPNLIHGIAFDDAVVTLKRYVLTELRDQELASLLGRFQKLIRAMDTATLNALVVEVEQRLARSP